MSIIRTAIASVVALDLSLLGYVTSVAPPLMAKQLLHFSQLW